MKKSKKMESINDKKFQALEKSKMNKLFGGAACKRTVVGTSGGEGKAWTIDGYDSQCDDPA